MSTQQASATALRGFYRGPDYSEAPVVLFWEITRACALACRHCRAEAQPRRHPLELTDQKCLAVVDDIAQFQPPPLLVITGGDPLMRRDLFYVASYAVSRGLIVSLSPSVTALVTRKNLDRLRQAGVGTISFSLDGATPPVHDGFRGVPGSFDQTLGAIAMALDAGLKVQVNTTVCRWTARQLRPVAELVQSLGAEAWSVFFLVPTGRAQAEEMLSAEEHERVYHWLYELSSFAGFRVKTTLGQPYRRVVLQRAAKEGRKPGYLASTNDGKGVCFISHLGKVYPSGFLPVACGNVRERSVVDIYRSSPVFQALRNAQRLKGKCGLCPYNTICGGCRARAYAVTGDYLEAEPCCDYQPVGDGPIFQ